MFKNTSLYGLGLGVLMLAAGCAKYKPKPLPNMLNSTDGTEIYAYAMTSKECKHAFSRNAKKHGLQAVHLSIANNTANDYVLDGNNLGLAIEQRSVVASTLQINTGHRVLSWAIPGFLLAGSLLLPAVYEYFACSSANKSLKNDFNARVIGSESQCNIPAGATISKVFFTAIDRLPASMSLKLRNTETNKLEIFPVTLHR
jgi:hypothetical protein